MDPQAAIDGYRFIAAGLHLLPTLVWVILAHSYWRSRGTARPRGGVLPLFRVLCGILAVHYGLSIVIDLVHPGTGRPNVLWILGCVLTKATTLAELAVLRHLIPLATLGGTPPSRLWLAVNYGSALGVGMITALAGTFSEAADAAVHVYLLAMTLAIVWDVLRLARGRGGRWRPIIIADLGSKGFALFGLVMFAGVVVLVLVEQNRPGPDLVWVTFHSAIGVALAALFALRILGEVARRFLVSLAGIVAAAVIYFGTHAAAPAVAGGSYRGLVELAGVLTLVLVLGPGSRWFRGVVDRLIQRQCRLWDQHLQSFLLTLSPELGVAECRRRAVFEVVRILKLRGAGMLPDDVSDDPPAGAVIAGKLQLTPVARVWPRGEPARKLPTSAFDLLWLRDVELQEALHDSAVTWVIPVTSPRKRWGHLFVAAGTLGISAGGARLETLERFVRQLALALDSADLMSRTVAAERELAQAGKLAAVGEMAARMAHEIRNPVTAARSLAQTLASEPDSPHNAEHAGIITRELDRVEHQIRSLLEFARRETYRFEEVPLTDLVRATLADLEPCLSGDLSPGGKHAAHHPDSRRIVPELELEPGVLVQADPERLRQVLINLVENAADAVRETDGPGRLKVAVSSTDTRATLSVSDTGPGIAPEALARIFDPFYSQKARGTGLGLAIARRICEAHGGRIEAESTPGGGAVFRVELLLAADDLASAPGAEPVLSTRLEQAIQ